jgi:hypothetical protein
MERSGRGLLWGNTSALALRDRGKPQKKLSQDSRFPSWDVNPRHPCYTAGVLTSLPWYSFKFSEFSCQVFCVAATWNIAAGYQSFGGSGCFHLQGEVKSQAGGSKVVRIVGILPQRYMTSQRRRHRSESSTLWKPEISHSYFCDTASFG